VGERYTLWYTPVGERDTLWYTRVCKRDTHPGVYTLVYVPPYPPWYICLYTTLGTPTIHPAAASRTSGHRTRRCYGEEALGSNLWLIPYGEPPVSLRTARVWQLLDSSAQSYSALPVRNIGKIG